MKNWTIKQRIYGSFALILILMALMEAFAWLRLDNIDDETLNLQDDAVPGLYHSTSLRAAWYENYILTQQLSSGSNEMQRDDVVRKLQQNTEWLDKASDHYQATIHDPNDQQLFNQFGQIRTEFANLQQALIRQAHAGTPQDLQRQFAQQLLPVWQSGQSLSQRLVDENKAFADTSVMHILQLGKHAQTSMLIGFTIALIGAALCGFLLLRAITVPMRRLMDILDVMRSGDFSQRLQIDRQDEFAHLAAGFNRMTDELTALVGQAQKVFGTGSHIGHRNCRNRTTATGNGDRNRRHHHRNRSNLTRNLCHLA